MADQRVNVKVTTQGAGKAKTELKGVEGAISKMGKAVGIASAAYFGARGLINGFSAVIKLAGEQEKAEKKLEVALGKRSQALLDQASALQQVTTFGDEAIIGVQSSIAAFLDSEDQIKKATAATLDMAVAMGMDLKSSGDLIAKTLGSSTNALARYGIEVTGAVGSTERLESLTENVARLFGGQAKAQADTMSGAIEQMSNAVGDAGEAIGTLLAPVVISVAKAFKTASEVVGAFFRNLSPPDFDEIIENLKSVNAEVEIISQMERLKLTSELIDVNNELIKLGESETSLADVSERTKTITGDLAHQQERLARFTLEGNHATVGFINTLISRMQEEAQEVVQVGELITKRQKLQETINALDESQTASIETTKKEVEVNKELGQAFETTLELRRVDKDAILGVDEAYQNFTATQKAKLANQIAESGMTARLIDQYPELAKALGLVNDKAKQGNNIWENFSDNLEQAGANAIFAASSITSTEDALFTAEIAAKKAAIAFISAEIQKAVSAYISSTIIAAGPAAPFVAAGAIAAGAAFGSLMGSAIERMEFAALGTDQIVNKPTLFMTGERGAERVQVTPLQGPNINGPQGLTINFNGPITDQGYVRDFILPEIERTVGGGLA